MTRAISILAIAIELGWLPLVTGASVPPERLDGLLTATGRQVERFWDEFSSVTCIESVDQVKIGENGKAIVERKNRYDYLVLLQFAGGELMVEESRVLQGKKPKPADRALLTTSGFSTLALIFHPYFRGSFAFKDEGSDSEKPWLRRVRFEHVRGQRTPSVLQLRSREYGIDWTGVAWIDSAGNIARIHASLAAPMEDLGLKALDADVRYEPVAVHGKQIAPWMPASAEIEAETKHQHWRNRHEFSSYRQFNVEADSKAEAPKEVEDK